MIASGVPIIFNSAQLSANVVLTGNVKNGEILDEDINNAAAVAWSKISKTASRFSDLASHDANDTDTTLGVAKGGTGKTSITAHYLLAGNAANAPSEIAPDTAGKVLTSRGASLDPDFETLPAGIVYGVDAVGTDAYAITPSPAVSAYANGLVVLFQALVANTGFASLNVSGLGAKEIVKKGAGTLANNDIIAGQMVMCAYNEKAITISSYSEANQDGQYNLSSGVFGNGQAFTAVAGKVTKAKFYLKKTNSPTHDMVAKIYASTGTMGTDAKPTGAALATSDAVNASTLGAGYALIDFNFTGANQISLTGGTGYCVVVEDALETSTNTIQVGRDDSAPSHEGNYCWTNDTPGTWYGTSSNDVCFYLLGLSQKFEMISQIAN